MQGAFFDDTPGAWAKNDVPRARRKQRREAILGRWKFRWNVPDLRIRYTISRWRLDLAEHQAGVRT